MGNLVSEFPSLFSFHCAFANESTIKKYEVSADDREGPPVPISNTEVKLTSAEDTWLATAWENRSVLTQKTRQDCSCLVFYIERGKN